MERISIKKDLFSQSVVGISAKIANAVEKVQRSEELAKAAKDMLIKLQLEVEQLYILQEKGKQ